MRTIALSLLVGLFAQASLAVDKMYDVYCDGAKSDAIIDAEVFGDAAEDKVKFAVVYFEEDGEAIAWKLPVDHQSGFLYLSFTDGDISLEASLDDVGAMSEITVENNRKVPLTCTVVEFIE